MISCINFKKRLNDFIYDSLSEDFKASMEEHIQSCECCKMMYSEELQIKDAFKDVINIRNIKFSSSRDEIIKNIDNNRYNRSLSNKLYYRIRRNFISYAASAVILLSIVSGGIYFYKSYSSNTNSPAASKEDYNFVANIRNNKINGYEEKAINAINSSFVETELPLPETSNKKVVQELLQKIKSEPLSGKAWTLGYTDNNKIIFYNDSALLACSLNGDNLKYYAGIDLTEIEGRNIADSFKTFSFSTDGNLVVINNSSEKDSLQDNKYNMYLFNFKSGELKIISSESKYQILDSWSSSSNFYVFGDKNGERIFIYDVISGSSMTIPFNNGAVNNIFVSDNGDIIIESSQNNQSEIVHEKYILKRENLYKSEALLIPGSIIGIRDNRVLYYDNYTIYELVSGKNNPIRELGPGFYIKSLFNKYSTFTDGILTYVYDYNNNIYKFNIPEADNEVIEFSQDFKKCAVIDKNNAKIYYSDNFQDKTELGHFDSSSSIYSWCGSSLVRISQSTSFDKFNGFSLYKANILPSKSNVESIPKSSDGLKEKYSTAILIDGLSTSPFERANIILVNYFNYLKSDASPEDSRIKDYKIKVIRIEKENSGYLQFSVEYSLLPEESFTSPPGKSKDDMGWYNDIFNSISVYSEDNIYYIYDISN